MRKLRLREVKSLSTGHTAALPWSQDSDRSLENSKGSVTSGPVLEGKFMGRLGSSLPGHIDSVPEPELRHGKLESSSWAGFLHTFTPATEPEV